MKFFINVFIFLIFLAGCGKQSKEGSFEMAVMSRQASAPAPPEPLDLSKPQVSDKKKIIKDGRIGLKVTDIEKAKNSMDQLVEKYMGYYANESFDNNDYASTYNLKISIPAANFEKLIDDIESGEGEVTYKNIDARDVTEEFIDLETRLENKRAYLKKYNELLKQARSVKDIIEIQENMRRIEEEIESSLGRLKYLSDQVSFSTLDVMITKEKEFKFEPAKRNKFLERLKQSLSAGWFGFISFLLLLIRLWPLGMIAAIVILVMRSVKRRKKKSG